MLEEQTALAQNNSGRKKRSTEKKGSSYATKKKKRKKKEKKEIRRPIFKKRLPHTRLNGGCGDCQLEISRASHAQASKLIMPYN
jgi:hypothetical protein